MIPTALRQLLDVVHQAIRVPMCVHLAPPTEGKPVQALLCQMLPKIGATVAMHRYVHGGLAGATAGLVHGFFGQPMISYYYKGDAKTLANSKSACQAQGGKWQCGPPLRGSAGRYVRSLREDI